MRVFVLLMLSLIALAPAAADDLPIPYFEATYNILRGNLAIGETVRSLKQDANGYYVFASSNRSKGIAALFVKDQVSERSVLRFQDNRVIPAEYQYERVGGKKERHTQLRFDWIEQRVTNDINQDPWVLNIAPGTLDKHLYQLQIMLDLAEGRSRLSYQIADSGRLKTYDIEVVGEAVLDTQLGKLDTVIVKRVKDNSETTLWCAKDLHFLPVQISQVEKDGSTFKARIKSLTGMVASPRL